MIKPQLTINNVITSCRSDQFDQHRQRSNVVVTNCRSLDAIERPGDLFRAKTELECFQEDSKYDLCDELSVKVLSTKKIGDELISICENLNPLANSHQLTATRGEGQLTYMHALPPPKNVILKVCPS